MSDRPAEFPNSATPLGSSAYYVVRFSPAACRDRLAQLFLFKQELQNLYTLSDPGVARIKLQWWQQQITTSDNQPADLPLIHDLRTMLNNDSRRLAALQAMIRETDFHLQRRPYEDMPALLDGAANLGGSFLQLLDSVCEKSVAQHPDHDLVQPGAFVQVTEWLQLFGQHLRFNLRLLPADLLQQQALQPQQLLQPDYQDSCRQLLGGMATELRSRVPLPKAVGRDSPAMKYLRLRRRLLQLLQQEDFAVLHQKISLTPIRKLWLAW